MSTARGISRRNVLVGAAWAAPTVLVATGSPAAATSQLSVSATATRETYPGALNIAMTVPATAGTITVTVTWSPSELNKFEIVGAGGWVDTSSPGNGNAAFQTVAPGAGAMSEVVLQPIRILWADIKKSPAYATVSYSATGAATPSPQVIEVARALPA